jgi:hypothetical protein
MEGNSLSLIHGHSVVTTELPLRNGENWEPGLLCKGFLHEYKYTNGSCAGNELLKVFEFKCLQENLNRKYYFHLNSVKGYVYKLL